MKDSKKNNKEFIFKKSNYRIMIIGIAFIVIGFVLMAGGGSDDPNILVMRYILKNKISSNSRTYWFWDPSLRYTI